MTVAHAKTQLRRDLRARLEAVSPAERAASAGLICQRARELDCWKTARNILLFAPLPDEVNIWPLLEAVLKEGKVLALPRYDAVKKTYTAARVADLKRDLVKAAFDIFEPATQCREIPLREIQLALVPGLAFDVIGNRLGRGMGYYDRLLAKFSGIKCGVAADRQVLAEILTEPHDVRMDLVLTNERLVTGKRLIPLQA